MQERSLGRAGSLQRYATGSQTLNFIIVPGYPGRDCPFIQPGLFLPFLQRLSPVQLSGTAAYLFRPGQVFR